MYRIVAVILFSFIYSVQSNSTTCHMTPILKESRNQMQICFKDVVQAHLTGSVPGKCSNVSEFAESLNTYYKKMGEECKFNVSTEKLLQFVNYSLLNETFKEFYDDIHCVEENEKKISACVANAAGYFNTTQEKKHSSWYNKTMLKHSKQNCNNTMSARTCTLKVLSSCQNATREYVASLFDFSLQYCNNTSENKTTVPPELAEPLTMSKPALASVITISVLIVIVVLAVLYIKCWRKRAGFNVRESEAE